MKRSTGIELAVLACACLAFLFSGFLPRAETATLINPANQINWPSCSAGQPYLPDGNSCRAVIGTDTDLLSAGTISGAGNPVCVDSSGGVATQTCNTPFAVFAPGVMSNSQVIWMTQFVVAYTVPASCAGSYLHALTAATGSTAVTLYDVTTATTLCTATFAGSGMEATWSGSGGTISIGDVVEVNGPATADATLANTGGQILAIR